MRSITRPLATAGATLLLVLALSACGDDKSNDSGKADDKASSTDSSQTTESESSDGESAASDGSSDPSVGVPTAGPADASTKEFCNGLKEITETVSAVKGDVPTEAEWKAIQQSYADLGDIGAPDGASDRQVEGFEVIVDAVTGLSYAQAKAEFGPNGGDTIPGVSAEENKKANEFFTYAASACADTLK